MNEQERSLFDEIWEAAGLKEESKQAPAEEPKAEEAPAAEEPKAEEAPAAEEPAAAKTIAEEATIEEPAAAETVAEEATIEEVPAKEESINKSKKNREKPAKKAKKEKKQTQDHAEKKKSVKFLVIYTIVFVIVISALVSGSYMISQRIHLENNEAQSGREHQSHLQNIKDKNEALKEENANLKEQNENLTVSEQDSTELLDSAADMIEHQEYLSAAMAKYIDGNRADARAILATVDREKLSPTAKDYYDLLDQKLN
ncbi:MAG: hypothetical protein IJ995_01690 [Clostridia bacterium]|nr:hypothetical protein [Clostridia bacterium]